MVSSSGLLQTGMGAVCQSPLLTGKGLQLSSERKGSGSSAPPPPQ